MEVQNDYMEEVEEEFVHLIVLRRLYDKSSSPQKY